MEKRVLLAVFLSFLVLYAYQALFPAPKPARRPAPTANAPSRDSVTAGTPAQAPPAPLSRDEVESAKPQSVTPAPPGDAQPMVTPLVSDAAERSVAIETSTVKVTFSNRGAQATSWMLKRYTDTTGDLVNLVPSGLPAATPRPFALRADDETVTKTLRTALYRVTVGEGQPAGSTIQVTQPTKVTFEYREPSGLAVRKVFQFEPTGYMVTFTSSASHAGRVLNPVLEWGPGLGDSHNIVGQKSSFGAYVQYSQGILLEDGTVHRLNAEGVAKAPSHQGVFPFAGIDDHYFIATLVNPGLARVQYAPQYLSTPGAPEQREYMAWSVLFARPPTGARFFVGPKDFDVLASVDRTLVKTIYFGMWDFLAVPLLRALKWVDAFVGNYGWSIIILTILINLAMFPLRHKSVVSMRKMQELQPQIKAIQERYAKFKATDPERQKQNTELMALYKEKGVNPASGCLPMLLTMPVLFAFYSVLSVAIEMRGAPFALWIRDLSVHDPYYITPLIMAATMFWQQRLTPIADPAQARVMMLTPFMFLFFFLWAPSGLVIYWTVSNLLGIGQQTLTNRIIGAPVVKQVRPPAERRLKSAGAGSTENARKA